jgi:copper(I)-binding protein
MQSLPEGLAIPAKKGIVLEAGAAHLMLCELQVGLVQGRTFLLTLHFARAGDVTVTVRVRRKVDAAGVPDLPVVTSGDLTISLASAPPVSPSHR